MPVPDASYHICNELFGVLILLFSSGSLPTRQVQMFDVATPLVVELVLSASYVLPPLLVSEFIFFLFFDTS